MTPMMKTQHAQYLDNQFLIAMPTLEDSNFSRTVSYLCQHNAAGALAIIINRPTTMTLGNIFEQMQIETPSQQIKQTPVFLGGPVQQEHGFIIHTKDDHVWDSSLPVSATTVLTSSRDILEAIANNEGPDQYLVALGYAGWGAGQLEQEIINNAWLTSPCAPDILYNTPVPQRWDSAANQIGIDITQLTTPAGHG
ncbi:MAG: YqgE/AlgH family protein [Methylococcales bacterium]